MHWRRKDKRPQALRSLDESKKSKGSRSKPKKKREGMASYTTNYTTLTDQMMNTITTRDIAMSNTGTWISVPRMRRTPQGDDWPVEIHATKEGRLHNDNGPAVVYADGEKHWFINGVAVTEKIVKGQITRDDILTADNQEVRRIMIEKIGPRKFRAFFKPKVLAADQYGQLVELDIGDDPNTERANAERRLMMMEMHAQMRYATLYSNSSKMQGEAAQKRLKEIRERIRKLPRNNPYIAVHVTDPSTEREYYLRVPPEFKDKTPRAAVAWTFNVAEKDYHPIAEA